MVNWMTMKSQTCAGDALSWLPQCPKLACVIEPVVARWLKSASQDPFPEVRNATTDRRYAPL